MSEFEFVLIAIAIVSGFAISEILAGWGRGLSARGGAPYSGLQFFASLTLLFQILRYVWTLWNFRSVEWQFWSFMAVLIPMLVLALAAHVISLPPSSPEVDPEEVYFARARSFFLLLSLLPLILVGYRALSSANPLLSPMPAASPTTIAIRAVSVPAFLWLAYTRRRSHHWIVLGLIFASLLYFSLQYTITLQQ